MGQVSIVKKKGGLGITAPSKDGIAGLIVFGHNSDLPSGGFQLDTAYVLQALSQAELIGITADYDTDNHILLHRNIKDFFVQNPNGTLHLYITDQLIATGATAITALIESSNGEISLIGEMTTARTLDAVAPNALLSVPEYDETEMHSRVSQMQSFSNTILTAHNVPLVFVLEGRIEKTTPIELDTLQAPRVAVCAAQDGVLTEEEVDGIKAYKNHALVGLTLGVLSKARVNENLGHVEKYNVFGGDLIATALFGLAPDVYTNAQADAKRLIYLKSYNGISGLYFNDSFTCEEETDDFATIENNRTWDKAYRLIRTALLPDVNSPISVDPTSGKLSPEIVKKFELKARRALDEMLTNEELSGVTVTVDPDQNILSTSNLDIEVSLVPIGVARNITGTIGFSNPF